MKTFSALAALALLASARNVVHLPDTVPHVSHGQDRYLQQRSQQQDSKAAAQDLFRQYNLSDSQLGATVLAYLYSSPLLAFVSAVGGAAGLTAQGVNAFNTTGRLADPLNHAVVRPNVDTVYSLLVYDLALQDAEFAFPSYLTDRYYSFAFYDPFGDNYASLGTVHADQPGRYLLRTALNTGRSGLSQQNCTSLYRSCIDSPTQNGFLLVRIEAKNNSTDIANVRNILGDISITLGARRNPQYPALIPSTIDTLPANQVAKALTLAARLSLPNPPQDKRIAQALPYVYKLAGIDTDMGSYSKPASVDLARAQQLADGALAIFAVLPSTSTRLPNNWTSLSASYSGSFRNGTDIVARSFVARYAYLQTTPDQAIYPSPPQRSYTLLGNESLLLTFTRKPDLPADGFWSLTLYDRDSYLVPNKAGVYAVGDRTTALEYPDGSKVNTPASDARPFKVLVQRQDLAPPANWTGNWLPAPVPTSSTTPPTPSSPASAVVQLTLRLYHPSREYLDGSYIYPRVERVQLVRAAHA